MSLEQQFWWNWSVNLAVALGTFFTVVVALFGDKLRTRFFPPLLRMNLLDPGGEKTLLTEADTGRVVDDVRFYHLRITNGRRWSPATNVQIFLDRIETPGPDGAYQIVWIGNVPMRWRDQEVVPLQRTIGADADCDLCRVGRSTGISLMPLITPNSLSYPDCGPCKFIVSLQARATEADSSILRIQISWDGDWHDGQAEMQRHLIVTRTSHMTRARRPAIPVPYSVYLNTDPAR